MKWLEALVSVGFVGIWFMEMGMCFSMGGLKLINGFLLSFDCERIEGVDQRRGFGSRGREGGRVWRCGVR